MAEQSPRDQNFVPAALFESSTQPGVTSPGQIIVATGRVKVDLGGGGGGTVTQLDSDTGIELTPDPITTTGTIGLIDSLKPLATLGTANQLIRVNAGATALEYFTASLADNITVGTTTITSGTTTRVLYDNAGVLGEYVISGTGNVAMTTSPVFTTPNIGAATATSINGLTITASTGTLTVANGKTLTQSNTLTYQGTDGSTVSFGTGGTVLYAASTIPLTVGTTTIASGTTTRILYDNAGVLGEYTLTGSGTVVAMQTAPTFVTSITTPSVLATSNDSGALGASGTAFSDLFLASGALINFAAGNYTLTHSSGLLTTSGALTVGGTLALGANSVTMTGSLAATGSRVTKGWFTDIESTNMITINGTSLSSATVTFTNKRIQPRTSTAASGDITPDLATANIWQRTALAAGCTINAPTGTPVLGEVLVFMLLDDGTSRSLTWNSAFTTRPMGAALPTATTISKQLLVTAQYNGATWLALSVQQT